MARGIYRTWAPGGQWDELLDAPSPRLHSSAWRLRLYIQETDRNRLIGTASHLLSPPMTHAGGTPGESRLTVLLDAAAAGDREAFGRAFSLLYDELSRLARSQRRKWVGNETMSTSVLVHEAYLKFVGSEQMAWEGRRHFFALAAQVMRQVLVNYAEQQRAAKRGGGADAVGLEVLDGADANAVLPDAVHAHTNPPDESMLGNEDGILALHRALEKLEHRDARQARIVECRFFAGLSIPATADALGISAATVKREWLEARTWLYAELAART